MNEFRSIRPEELSGNPFRLIGHDWMLVTSADPGDGLVCGRDYNTMTASWGGMGILWGGPVAFVVEYGLHSIANKGHDAPFTAVDGNEAIVDMEVEGGDVVIMI